MDGSVKDDALLGKEVVRTFEKEVEESKDRRPGTT